MNPFPGKTVIGLTGGIASGKSTALKIFEQLGWETISVDSIVSEFFEKDERVRDTLRKRWGNELFFSGGIVDKSKIAQIIFNDPSERSWLESFLHPLVRSHWVKFIGNSSKERFVVELPLLFENKLKSHFTKILCIYVPMDLQVSRMLERGSDESEAMARIQAQMPSTDKVSLSDYVLLGSGSEEFLCSQIKRMIKTFSQASQ